MSPSKRVCDGKRVRLIALMRRLGHQVAFELGEAGVRRHHDQRRVLALDERQRVRERRGVRGRRRSRQQAAVVAHHVADRVHDRQRPDHRVVDARRRRPEAAGHAVVGALPLPDRRARPRPDLPGRERAPGLGGGEGGDALVGTGPDAARARRGRTPRPPARSGPSRPRSRSLGPAPRATASRRRRRRARTPTRR